jgi:hypothetical protein
VSPPVHSGVLEGRMIPSLENPTPDDSRERKPRPFHFTKREEFEQEQAKAAEKTQINEFALPRSCTSCLSLLIPRHQKVGMDEQDAQDPFPRFHAVITVHPCSSILSQTQIGRPRKPRFFAIATRHQSM